MAATKTPAQTAAGTDEEKLKKMIAEAPVQIMPDLKAMTLAQKFVLLRQACPEIVKRQHSDGVKYKFAKIFDVYELLAPAMIEFGVDWEIFDEKATRHYDNGDEMYWTTYVQHTRNGDRVVWVYEADLFLRWINVADASDTQEVKLHAIGTNDGGPDKAKGSAWTYALKYYLFEKFNIDQGEDDPDNADHGSEAPQNVQNGRQNAGQPQGNRGQVTQQNGQQRPATLSEAQLNRLYKKAEACGMTKEQVAGRVKAKYKHDNPAELTRAQYDEICAALDASAAQKQQGGNENAE